MISGISWVTSLRLPPANVTASGFDHPHRGNGSRFAALGVDLRLVSEDQAPAILANSMSPLTCHAVAASRRSVHARMPSAGHPESGFDERRSLAEAVRGADRLAVVPHDHVDAGRVRKHAARPNGIAGERTSLGRGGVEQTGRAGHRPPVPVGARALPESWQSPACSAHCGRPPDTKLVHAGRELDLRRSRRPAVRARRERAIRGEHPVPAEPLFQ